MVLDPRVLALSFESAWKEDLAIPWVHGIDVVSGHVTWVPYELVHSDARLPLLRGKWLLCPQHQRARLRQYPREALLHGLCELIERDASTLDAFEPGSETSRRLDPSTVDDPAACELLGQYDSADIDVMVWDTTTDLGVASFRAQISDRLTDPVLRPSPAAAGAGTHPNRSVALVRALTEAAQSRLTAISGSV